MRRIMVLVVAVALAAASAAATDQTDVLKTVHQFVDSFNKGDMKSSLATCASPASVIDEFPPYAWQGPTACADWARDYDAAGKQEGITAGHVAMGKPLHVEVVGDHAYTVFPVTFSSKHKGKLVTEPPAKLVVVLHKGAEGWKITSWAWSNR